MHFNWLYVCMYAQYHFNRTWPCMHAWKVSFKWPCIGELSAQSYNQTWPRSSPKFRALIGEKVCVCEHGCTVLKKEWPCILACIMCGVIIKKALRFVRWKVPRAGEYALPLDKENSRAYIRCYFHSFPVQLFCFWLSLYLDKRLQHLALLFSFDFHFISIDITHLTFLFWVTSLGIDLLLLLGSLHMDQVHVIINEPRNEITGQLRCILIGYIYLMNTYCPFAFFMSLCDLVLWFSL